MLFADGNPDPNQLGSWIIILVFVLTAFAIIIGAIATVYQAFFKKKIPNPTTNLVTRGELDASVNRLEIETKEELRRVESSTKDSIKETKDMVSRVESDVERLRDRIHKLSDKMHVVNLRMVYIQDRVDQLCNKMGIPSVSRPNISPEDEA